MQSRILEDLPQHVAGIDVSRKIHPVGSLGQLVDALQGTFVQRYGESVVKNLR